MTLPATPTAPPLAKLALLLQLLILLTLSVNGAWRKTVRLELEPGVVAQALASESEAYLSTPAIVAAVLVIAALTLPRRAAAIVIAPTRRVAATRPLRITHRPPGQAPPLAFG